jgi:hypothetical protein
MPGSEGQPAGRTWDQWPLAMAGPDAMLTGSASRHQARQAKLAMDKDVLAGPDGPIQTRTGRRRHDRHATRASWRATLTGAPASPRSVG